MNAPWLPPEPGRRPPAAAGGRLCRPGRQPVTPGASRWIPDPSCSAVQLGAHMSSACCSASPEALYTLDRALQEAGLARFGP